MSKYIKFLCALLSCCVILFGCAAPHVNAVAGVDDLVIGGAAIMTIGLVGVLGMLSINAAGFSDALYQAASEANQDIRAFASSLFASYARTQNITAGQAVNLAAQGTSYLEDGTIIFNKAMSDMMSGFINWAWDEDGGNLIASASELPAENITVSIPSDNVFSIPSIDYCQSSYFSWSNNNSSNNYYGFYVGNIIGGFLYGSSGRFLVASDSPVLGNWGTSSLSRSDAILTAFNKVDSGSSIVSNNSFTYDNNTVYFYDSNISGVNIETSFSVTSSISDSNKGMYAWLIVYGNYGVSGGGYDVNLDVLDQIADDSTDVNLLNPNDFITVSDAPVGGGTINIEDWLNALADVSVGQTSSIPVEAEGVITEAVGELAGTDDIAVTQDAVQSGSQAVADSTSVSGLDEFTLDLTDFFPFCIPFDIYDMLSMFAASREAPHFDYRFYIPGVCDETITIDLSCFDPVALVLRRVELVAFAIGLAFVTKKLIQGGD